MKTVSSRYVSTGLKKNPTIKSSNRVLSSRTLNNVEGFGEVVTYQKPSKCLNNQPLSTVFETENATNYLPMISRYEHYKTRENDFYCESIDHGTIGTSEYFNSDYSVSFATDSHCSYYSKQRRLSYSNCSVDEDSMAFNLRSYSNSSCIDSKETKYPFIKASHDSSTLSSKVDNLIYNDNISLSFSRVGSFSSVSEDDGNDIIKSIIDKLRGNIIRCKVCSAKNDSKLTSCFLCRRSLTNNTTVESISQNNLMSSPTIQNSLNVWNTHFLEDITDGNNDTIKTISISNIPYDDLAVNSLQSSYNICQFIQSEEDALKYAILLSRQEAEFGINMIEALTKNDEVFINNYVAQGLRKIDAIKTIFENKFGLTSVYSENSPKHKSVASESPRRKVIDDNKLDSQSTVIEQLYQEVQQVKDRSQRYDNYPKNSFDYQYNGLVFPVRKGCYSENDNLKEIYENDNLKEIYENDLSFVRKKINELNKNKKIKKMFQSFQML